MSEDATQKAIEAVNRWLEWAKRTGTEPPADLIVASVVSAYGAALVPDADGWFPIESHPDGEHCLLFFRHGERGVGGVETGMLFKRHGEPWHYWTHGGPNSGTDWEPADCEKPVKWKPYTAPKQ